MHCFLNQLLEMQYGLEKAACMRPFAALPLWQTHRRPSMHSTGWLNRALLPAETLHQLCCACPAGLDEQKQKKSKFACFKAFCAVEVQHAKSWQQGVWTRCGVCPDGLTDQKSTGAHWQLMIKGLLQLKQPNRCTHAQSVTNKANESRLKAVDFP